MKKILILLLIIVCSVSVFSEDKPIITVLDFETNGVSNAEMISIISLLSSALFKTDHFTVIDVSQRNNILKEMEFSMSGCSDESCMLEIGKMLSAEAIIVGSIGRVGSKYVLSAKMLDTETARTLNTADGIYKNLDKMLDDISDIAGNLTAEYKDFEAAKKMEEQKTGKKPSKINIPAIASLAGGVVSAGIGIYCLAESLPLLIDYTNAKKDYEEAETGDITALYDIYEEARQDAYYSDANEYFAIGASLTGVGIALGTLSVILFKRTSKEDSPEVDVAFLPGFAVSTLTFSVRY